MNHDAPLFEAASVSRIYRRGTPREVRAVDGASLRIAPGTCWALTGPSGSGKSTLLALLGGLDRPTAGKVRFRGESLAGLSDVGLARIRRRLGFVFQNFALLPRLAVWENVTYALVPRGVSRSARLRLAAELLEPLGLANRLHETAETLSGGEQQRVALARALAGRPEALLADEPTSQLDPVAAESIRQLLAKLVADGATLVLATHEPRLIALATHVAAIDAGQLTITRE
jgi:putative ABC transport system ATP-binding protein